MSFYKSTLTALLVISGTAYALDPVQGFYGGIFLGGSYAPSIDFKVFNPDPTVLKKISGSLSYGPFVNGGGQVGYRRDQFRAEAEAFYNYNPYNTISADRFKITKYKKKFSKPNTIYQMGHTGTAALMVNGFYDIYSMSDYVPYVGVGVGYAHVTNSLQFYYGPTTKIGTLFSESKSLAGLQGILGVNYFMDDFTTIGLDFRYFTTQSTTVKFSPNTPSSFRYQFATLNLSISGAFDCG